MKIKVHRGHGGSQICFGPYIEWPDWNIWHRTFDIGFYFGPWIFYLTITLWDVEEAIQMLRGYGLPPKEAWDFVDEIRRDLPDPYNSHVNMKREIEQALIRRGAR